MKPKLSRAETIARNKVDKLIEATVYTQCNGLTIDIMDISKVYQAGYTAATAATTAGLGPIEYQTMVAAAVVAKYKELAK